MKAELEVTFRVTFDPKTGVSPEEAAALDQLLGIVRRLRARDPAAVLLAGDPASAVALAAAVPALPPAEVDPAALSIEAASALYRGVPTPEAAAGRRRLAERALAACAGSRTRAAKALGISRAAFHEWRSGSVRSAAAGAGRGGPGDDD